MFLTSPVTRELEVVPDLLMSGAMAHLDNLHVDWSRPDFLLTDSQTQNVVMLKRAMEFLSMFAHQQNLSHVTEVRPQGCSLSVQISGEDDESYHEYEGPLPTCSPTKAGT